MRVPVLGHWWAGFLFKGDFDSLSGEPAVAQVSLAGSLPATASWEAFPASVGWYLCPGEGLSSFRRGSAAVKLQKSK